ncbi:MAG TPA: DUF4376 domain-containing protein [Fervidobacterium sp.]|nr:DUF4376 domain-containing protein [Fervidobacterium sp.]
MKYTVINNGKYAGVTYDDLNDRILAHHIARGEVIIPVETSPQPISFDEDIPIYGDVDIDTLKQGKLWQLADARWREETSGYMYNGHEFHSDRESQDRVFQAYMASLSDPNFTVTWKTKTGWLEMTASDFITLYNEFQTFLQALYQKEKNLQALVEAATTIDELNAIEW